MSAASKVKYMQTNTRTNTPNGVVLKLESPPATLTSCITDDRFLINLETNEGRVFEV